MRNNFKLSYSLVFATVLGLGIYSCKKQEGGTLGALPKADFAIVPGTNPNNITLVNKSNTPSIPYWRINNSSSLLSGDSAKTSFVFAGTYPVTMYVAGQGGIDSITKQVTVAQSDPTACVGTQLGFITSCTSKKWKLDPTATAYKVGPGPNDGSWWSSGVGDVTARSCEFNDEYTFAFTANQTFTYDNKGDFFGDGYLGNNSGACQPTANYTAAQAPWGSGTFKYSFAPNAGINKLGQLTVIGLGAHIGLQKVRNGGEVTTGPASSITYDVLSETHDAGGNYDLLTLGVDIGGGGWWTFRLRSF
jgi:hypothetical protein